ncbi:DUF5343 domain-containing protein [Cellulomonas uda]|uniref:DUF5343 domain-containing protein n=1 Tax=Cellulomonas uda TaxID=1714 RepID=A0A4Y3KAL4_CELUD|nr:DUF5343 domain-containing protein [Cellulomonas uda]NII67419.1 hypothetical protein [Cellulomonas uda]GEA79860.1 hypothetical protein CUD01_03040 [Cellulomonas uda]
MALPSAYLTSFKNTPDIFRAIQGAQAPERFTQKFLEGLGFPSSNDRTMINVLKALGFLDDSGVPQRRYHEFLDQTRSAVVLAEGMRAAYADLFKVNKNAHTMTTAEVKNKMKTLSEGAFTERVLSQMAGTFTTLAKEADFSAAPVDRGGDADPGDTDDTSTEEPVRDEPVARGGGLRFGSLAYNINIVLPESRDPAVYDALFRALREHLQ